MQLLEDEPELTEKLGEIPVAVIEKGKACGAHNVSGANMVPSAMEKLFPDLDPSDWPVYQKVEKDAVYLLTKKRAIPLKPPPPNFRNHGNYVTSVSKLSRFLAEKAEEAGAYILTETVADKLLVEDRIVRGIRSGDKGRGRDGEELGNFEPGSDLMAKATVLAEGTVSHLTQSRRRLLRPRRRPDALGDRRQGGLEGPEAARPGHPHDELAAPGPRRSTTSSAAASSTRWARTSSASAWSSASTRPTRPSPATTRSSSSRPTRSSASCSTAASGSAGARRRSPPAATGRCRSGSPCPAW